MVGASGGTRTHKEAINLIPDYEKDHKRLLNSSMKCLNCENELKGKQKKFCCNQCKCKYHNFDPDGKGWKVYDKQKEKGYQRKKLFIELKGGSCQICGYNKSFRALTFHHRNPSEKRFQLDIRNLSNRGEESCKLELEKCDLLCFNCHMELHENENGVSGWN